MVALIFLIAFLPLTLIAVTRIHRVLKPPRHRPLIFIIGGTFLLSLGLLAGYALWGDLQSGIIHFTARRYGEFYASAYDDPLSYWTLAVVLYFAAILFSGFGLAGFGLCFNNKRDT